MKRSAFGDEAFAQLVLARIAEPTSKADSLRVLDDLGIAHVSLRTMSRSLRRAHDRDYRGRLAQAGYAHAVRAGDVSLCLYDVTTLYFEAETKTPTSAARPGCARSATPKNAVSIHRSSSGCSPSGVFAINVVWLNAPSRTPICSPGIRPLPRKRTRRHGAEWKARVGAGSRLR